MASSPPLAPETLPAHVAFIMDGNRRWADGKGVPRAMGHKQGAEALKRTVEAAGELGIGTLTFFGFSSENWQRSQEEVADLMGLLRFYLRSETAELNRRGARLRVIGEREKFPKDIVDMITYAEDLTAKNDKITVVIALSYGGRQDIVQAAQRLATQVQGGTLAPEDITADTLNTALWTAGLPDPDLLIRTSGEIRISNFLLWQCAYAEMVFQDLHWPDYNKVALEEALQIYARRQRRFGGSVSPPAKAMSR